MSLFTIEDILEVFQCRELPTTALQAESWIKAIVANTGVITPKLDPRRVNRIYRRVSDVLWNHIVQEVNHAVKSGSIDVQTRPYYSLPRRDGTALPPLSSSKSTVSTLSAPVYHSGSTSPSSSSSSSSSSPALSSPSSEGKGSGSDDSTPSISPLTSTPVASMTSGSTSPSASTPLRTSLKFPVTTSSASTAATVTGYASTTLTPTYPPLSDMALMKLSFALEIYWSLMVWATHLIMDDTSFVGVAHHLSECYEASGGNETALRLRAHQIHTRVLEILSEGRLETREAVSVHFQFFVDVVRASNTTPVNYLRRQQLNHRALVHAGVIYSWPFLWSQLRMFFNSSEKRRIAQLCDRERKMGLGSSKKALHVLSADERDRPSSLSALITFFADDVPADTLEPYHARNQSRQPIGMRGLQAVSHALQDLGLEPGASGLDIATRPAKSGARSSSTSETKETNGTQTGKGSQDHKKKKKKEQDQDAGHTPYTRRKKAEESGIASRTRSRDQCTYCGRRGHTASVCHRKRAGVGPNDPLPDGFVLKSRAKPPSSFATSPVVCRWCGGKHQSKNCRSAAKQKAYQAQAAVNQQSAGTHVTFLLPEDERDHHGAFSAPKLVEEPFFTSYPTQRDDDIILETRASLISPRGTVAGPFFTLADTGAGCPGLIESKLAEQYFTPLALPSTKLKTSNGLTQPRRHYAVCVSITDANGLERSRMIHMMAQPKKLMPSRCSLLLGLRSCTMFGFDLNAMADAALTGSTEPVFRPNDKRGVRHRPVTTRSSRTRISSSDVSALTTPESSLSSHPGARVPLGPPPGRVQDLQQRRRIGKFPQGKFDVFPGGMKSSDTLIQPPPRFANAFFGAEEPEEDEEPLFDFSSTFEEPEGKYDVSALSTSDSPPHSSPDARVPMGPPPERVRGSQQRLRTGKLPEGKSDAPLKEAKHSRPPDGLSQPPPRFANAFFGCEEVADDEESFFDFSSTFTSSAIHTDVSDHVVEVPGVYSVYAAVLDYTRHSSMSSTDFVDTANDVVATSPRDAPLSYHASERECCEFLSSSSEVVTRKCEPETIQINSELTEARRDQLTNLVNKTESHSPGLFTDRPGSITGPKLQIPLKLRAKPVSLSQPRSGSTRSAVEKAAAKKGPKDGIYGRPEILAPGEDVQFAAVSTVAAEGDAHGVIKKMRVHPAPIRTVFPHFSDIPHRNSNPDELKGLMESFTYYGCTDMPYGNGQLALALLTAPLMCSWTRIGSLTSL